jgi:hypothetical protein
MLDILIFSGSAGLGIVCAIFLYRFTSLRKQNEHGSVLGNVKYELNNLYFEKSVALEALEKINQFFEDKKIDEYERDRLSRKYIKMLDNYNKRVFQLKPILEAQEIYEYKKQLDSILQEYTKKIDSRLASITGHSAAAVTATADKKRSKVITSKKGTIEGSSTVASSSFSFSPSPSSSSSAISTTPSTELQPGFEVRHSPRSWGQQLKSSITKISRFKLDKDKNDDSVADVTKSIESLPSLDEKKSADSNSTTGTTANNNTKEDEEKQVDQVSPEIVPNLESLSIEKLQPVDSDETEKVNIDTKEIDKIQSDILRTLKRLEDS